jgi:hypothetical protein
MPKIGSVDDVGARLRGRLDKMRGQPHLVNLTVLGTLGD